LLLTAELYVVKKKIVCGWINKLTGNFHEACLLDYPETMGYGGSKKIFAKFKIGFH